MSFIENNIQLINPDAHRFFTSIDNIKIIQLINTELPKDNFWISQLKQANIEISLTVGSKLFIVNPTSIDIKIFEMESFYNLITLTSLYGNIKEDSIYALMKFIIPKLIKNKSTCLLNEIQFKFYVYSNNFSDQNSISGFSYTRSCKSSIIGNSFEKDKHEWRKILIFDSSYSLI
jgi:hypothetical protein